MGTYKSLKEKMPEEMAAQNLIKYTQKGIKFQREEDAGKELSKILADDLYEALIGKLSGSKCINID